MTATPAPRRAALALAAAAALLPSSSAAGFLPPPRLSSPPPADVSPNCLRSPTARLQYQAQRHSPLEDEPWRDDESYWDALQAASKDPATFERFIEESMATRGRKGAGAPAATSSSSRPSASNGANGSGGDGAPKKKRGKYVPIEDWEAQRERGEGMSAEERLQWECQRNGNRFRQNEILMHNLKSF